MINNIYLDSCQSLDLYAGEVNSTVSMQCTGSRGCRYMKLWGVQSPQLYINCAHSYSCQSAQIYSSNAGII